MSVERSALSVERSAAIAAIDRDNPWPGLATFTEDQGAYFHGRDDEIDDLTQLARLRALVVLFGQSGLGKSSLLQAGVFPRLRKAGFCPVYIRLDHAENAPSPTDQIKTLLLAETARMGAWTKPDAAKPGETLWELFHHRDDRLLDASGGPIIPVLVFDQFEELFTLGAAAGARRDRAVAFMAELAELVENRPSEQLVARLEASADELEAFDFSRADYRVVITLREDFLPDLEGMKTIMPALMANRMRLARMTGTQALQAVVKPGAGLVTEEVAAAVVEFVAGARGGSIERLAELNVEPALLSVVCRELNERRRTLGQAQITADLVSGNRREILTDFYDRSVADLPAPMRVFVEDRLLTKSGFRDNLALEAALEFPGVTQPLIDTLVARRLLRIEDRAGIQRVELTHDVLAEVIRASRDERQQRLAAAIVERRARRQHRLVGALGALLILAAAGVGYAVRSRGEARGQASRTDLVYGSQLLEEGKVPDGLAYLVRAARNDPENRLIASRLLSSLASHNFYRQQGKPLALPSPGQGARYSADGRHIYVLCDDNVLRVISADEWKIEREFPFGEKIVHGWSLAAKNPGVFAVLFEDGSLVACDAMTGRPRTPPILPPDGAALELVKLSPDGRWLAALGTETDSLWLWEVESGQLRAKLERWGVNFGGVAFDFSPDSRLIATPNKATSVQVWSVPDGAAVGKPLVFPSGLMGVVFSPDGRRLIAGSISRSQIFDVASGAPIGPELRGADMARGAAFSPDGRRLVVIKGQVATVVDAATALPVLPPLTHGGAAQYPMFSVDGRVLSTCSGDGLIRLWSMETGDLLAEPTFQQPHFTAPVVARDGTLAVMAPDGRQVVAFSAAGPAYRLRVGSGAARPLVISNRSNAALPAAFLSESPARILRLTRSGTEVLDAASGGRIAGGIVFPQPLAQDSAAAYLSPDQRTIVARTATDTWHAWNFSTAGLTGDVLLVDVPAGPPHVSFKSSGDALLVYRTDRLQSSFGQWSLESGRATTVHQVAAANRGAEFTRDGKRVFVTNWNQIGRAYDVVSGNELFSLKTRDPMRTASFSPDGRRLVTFGAWGYVRFWDGVTGQPISSHLRHQNIPQGNGVTFSRDGRYCASISYDGMAQVWDVETGTPVGEVLLHGYSATVTNQSVTSAAFSSDGTRVVTASITGVARVWDTVTGYPLTERMQHAQSPVPGSADFSPDGHYILTKARTGDNSFIYVWAVPPAEGAAPSWLLELATLLSGKRVKDDGRIVPATEDQAKFDELRRALNALPGDAPYVEWGRWLLDDRSARSIAPGFTITPADAEKLAQEMAAVPATAPPATVAPAPAPRP